MVYSYPKVLIQLVVSMLMMRIIDNSNYHTVLYVRVNSYSTNLLGDLAFCTKAYSYVQLGEVVGKPGLTSRSGDVANLRSRNDGESATI